ncbi:NAD(P)/FAD-dependent oxidoreductase [Comamonas squillarum]|uniref:NAD(P)/FAD-dependent oxidoreductase n=1 Tax=Comamonas squillarum TaxID=2977320 RepID=A0ABY6A6F3_9BURK|nr:NAD(P)/FAD-dependent oxidoreductase [Comamonas sp. PR12]UXC20790.1 NAD(P)/FAD-dependent oxidoreductase [Comamonas sp. PR12]
MHTDFAIVGGSYAGMSAALQLARARRQVTVIDAGLRRNRFVDEAGSTSHGFLSRDGMAPAQLWQEARTQLLQYPSVRWIDGQAEQAQVLPSGELALQVGGQLLVARRLVLATGVRDELPAVPGLAERWGNSVFHCPYCHGYEVGGGAIGVIAASPLAQHHALMLPDWGPTTLFLNGVYAPTPADLADFARRGTQIEATAVLRIDGFADVVLADGRTLAMQGLFTQPRTTPASPVAQQLGCVLADGPMGPYVQVDAMQQTSVANVFACGDAARAAGSIALSVADGAMAGVAAHRASML